MSYPQIVEYNDAIQSPERTLTDPELRNGSVKTNQLGLPLALSGGFALTYEVSSGGRRFAVRCFHREVPGIEQRYAAISNKIRSLNSDYFVDFDFQPSGIKVGGKSYPLLKMDWVQGDTLGIFLDRHKGQQSQIADLRNKLRELAKYLSSQDIAHGDLQNENIILANGRLRLIDYDGMYVPGMVTGKGSEIGHKHFQHSARTTGDFGPHIDRFSSIAIDIGLRAIAENSALQTRFSEGGATILFRANDYADPGNSEAFNALRSMSSIRSDAERFANLCQSPIASVPSLEDFIAGKGGLDRVISAQPVKPIRQGYIPAFTVVDAGSFASAEASVGQRVELIGQIVSVKEGTTRGRGRRGGKPYVFINFGDWQKSSVKLTLWSEALSKMQSQPDESWVGRWVSVTGLIDPPYHGTFGSISYVNVGITIADGSEIVQLTSTEAKYRLASKGQVATTASRALSNKDVLEGLKSGGSRTTSGRSPSPSAGRTTSSANRPTTTASSNQQILAGLRPTPGSSVTSGSGTSPTRQPPGGGSGSGSSVPWGWIIIGVIILFAIFG